MTFDPKKWRIRNFAFSCDNGLSFSSNDTDNVCFIFASGKGQIELTMEQAKLLCAMLQEKFRLEAQFNKAEAEK